MSDNAAVISNEITDVYISASGARARYERGLLCVPGGDGGCACVSVRWRSEDGGADEGELEGC